MTIMLQGSFGRTSNVWGLWTTAALATAIAALFILVQIAALFGYALFRSHHDPGMSVRLIAANMSLNGLVFSVATCASAVVCSGAIWLAVRLCRGATPADYLGLNRVPLKRLGVWIGSVPVLVLLSDLIEPHLIHPQGPDFTFAIYNSAIFLPLLWIALVIAAPVVEELFFRSFLLQGLRNSRLGTSGAIVLTSLAWAFLHSQYSSAEITEVFVFGVILGVARMRTGSVYTSIAMHATANLLTLIQVASTIGAH